MMMNTTLDQPRTLKLLGMAAGLQDQLTSAGMTTMSFEERTALLVEREVHWRGDKRRERLLKEARLKYRRLPSKTWMRAQVVASIASRHEPGAGRLDRFLPQRPDHGPDGGGKIVACMGACAVRLPARSLCVLPTHAQARRGATHPPRQRDLRQTADPAGQDRCAAAR